MNMTKLERIEKEKARLLKIFKDIPKDKLETVKKIINNVAFMAITLEDLEEAINTKGLVEDYQHGANQYGTKKIPEVDVYNVMIKNQMSIVKQLIDLLPKDAAKDAGGEFISYMSKTRK